METAEEYLERESVALEDAYFGDCRKRALHVRALLRAAARDAWIGRMRKVSGWGDSTFHGPLIPLRYRGRGRSAPAWTTHYVCVSDGVAYDPLIGSPVPMGRYSMTVFGEEIEVVRDQEP